MFAVPIIFIAGYLLGPEPDTPVYSRNMPVVPDAPPMLEKEINSREALHKVKPENHARIHWANDSLKQVTAYAIVYLHGFSASQGEGDPVHKNIANTFGCNLYISRLADHGIDTTDALINLTSDRLWESAKRALAIGKKIGKKVILMGTSTGGSLALMLARHYPEVHALILLSPNISIKDKNAWLLNNPWGLQLARYILNSDYIYSKDQSDIYKKYWYSQYRIEAAIELQELLETSMTPALFQQIKQPVLTLYFFRDDVHQDDVVDVSSMKMMMDKLGTPLHQKRSVAMPNTGDHVIGSYVKSYDYAGVQQEIEKFMIETLKVNPVR